MAERWVGGIFIERSQITVLISTHNGPDAIGTSYISVNPISIDTYKINKFKNLEYCVRHICENIGSKLWNKISGIGIACYGPFVSLDIKNKNYGLIHETKAALPFRGVNIYKLFRSELLAAGLKPDVRITVWHDANACALGEAVTSKLQHDKVLAYLLVTEGIGVGVVTGQWINKSALHPEIGPLQVRYLDDDPLPAPEFIKKYDRYSHCLSTLTNNDSLRKRYSNAYNIRNYKKVSDDMLINGEFVTSFYDFRGYYLSQACLALTVILAPSRIVIGTDIDLRGHTPKIVREHFASFLRAREGEDGALFDYDDISDEKAYISAPTRRSPESPLPTIGETGAIGMCAAAIRAFAGGTYGGRNG